MNRTIISSGTTAGYGNTGGLRKIGELQKNRPCTHPEHNPPGNIYLDPGIYEYVCPSCLNRIVFVIAENYC